jgi:hypothetical protein
LLDKNRTNHNKLAEVIEFAYFRGSLVGGFEERAANYSDRFPVIQAVGIITKPQG